MALTFYNLDEVLEEQYEYAVIAARYKDKWIFVKNKKRSWELPGGRREVNETIDTCAKRELYEETGAIDFELFPVSAYFIDTFGKLYYAKIKTLGPLPDFEIETLAYFDDLPIELSFPQFHPAHLEKVKSSIGI